MGEGEGATVKEPLLEGHLRPVFAALTADLISTLSSLNLMLCVPVAVEVDPTFYATWNKQYVEAKTSLQVGTGQLLNGFCMHLFMTGVVLVVMICDGRKGYQGSHIAQARHDQHRDGGRRTQKRFMTDSACVCTACMELALKVQVNAEAKESAGVWIEHHQREAIDCCFKPTLLLFFCSGSVAFDPIRLLFC